MPKTDAVVCFTTTNKSKEARKLAGALIKEKLAGCVQIIPKITSVYEWDGAIHEDQEWLLIIKTMAGNLEPLKAFIAKHHSYEVPELVVLDIIDGLPSYLDWLYEATHHAH